MTDALPIAYTHGDYKNAEAHCKQVYQHDKTSPAVLLLLSSIYFQRKMMEESAFYSNEAIRINPSLAEAYSNLGNVYKEQGHISQALQYYRHAVSLKRDFIDG